MVSESARAGSVAEARFRVQAPNARPRQTKVIALDETAEAVIRRLASLAWQNATLLSAAGEGGRQDSSAAPPRSGPEDGFELRDLNGGRTDLRDVIGAADLVVMVAGPGGRAQAAAR